MIEPTPHLGLLTTRERVVLALMAQGMTNAEIASSLQLAMGTVKAHASAIFGKLEARNRTEAVIMWLESEGFPQRVGSGYRKH